MADSAESELGPDGALPSPSYTDNDLFPEDPGAGYLTYFPLKKNADGSMALAWPGAVHDLVNAAAASIVGPGEVLTGRTPLGAPARIDPMKLANQITGNMLWESKFLGETPPNSMGAFPGWHGTPHTFEPVEHNPFGEFKDEKIGTGEGAQAYGWGHYVAGNKETAETYQYAGAGGPGANSVATIGGRVLDDDIKHEFIAKDYLSSLGYDKEAAIHHLKSQIEDDNAELNQSYMDGGYKEHLPYMNLTREDYYKNNIQNNWKAINLMRDPEFKIEQASGGPHLLNIQAKPDEDQLLHWDLPLAKQSPRVRDILRNMNQNNPEATGEEIYRGLSWEHGDGNSPSTKAASKALDAEGIPGIKFLDQGSRGMNPLHGGLLIDGKNVTGPELSPEIASLTIGDVMHGTAGFRPDYYQIGDAMRALHKYGSKSDAISALRDGKEKPFASGDASGVANWIEDNAGRIGFDKPQPVTHNYVIFDPKNLSIKGRDGEEFTPVEEDPFQIHAYHGTFAPRIDEFHPGTHFGTYDAAKDRLQNKVWSEENVKDASIHHVMLNPKGLIDVRDLGDWEPGDILSELPNHFTPEEHRDILDQVRTPADILRDKGYAGFRYKNDFEGSPEDYSYMMFDPRNNAKMIKATPVVVDPFATRKGK